MKNSLADLNNHLFAQLERLGDEELEGDKLNCRPENLECIPRALHCRLNKLQHSKADPDLQPTIRAIATLQVKQAERANV